MLTGARMAVPTGPSSIGGCMPREKGLAKHSRLKLLCNAKLQAGRALENESAHENASHAGLLHVEAFAGHPLNQAPLKSYESAVASQATHVDGEAVHGNSVSEQLFSAQQLGKDKQDSDIAEAAALGKQMLEEQITLQDADIASRVPQKSIEEALGSLKEEVEADRRIQLASKPNTEADGIADTSKPLKRSKILAKQVISQSSARAIGFVSQLWVSASLFKVIALEVRPSLLSGEIDRVYLNDICQIGDVVLVTDESALENEMTAVDCETLVGYDVVTEDGKYVGKIRDYSFDLDDGKLTSFDFDLVGFSLVPSSLISTYRLDVEELVEVLSDSIVVKDGAESRIRRLSKGLWQLPAGGEKRRNQRMARSRMLKKTLADGDDMVSMSRQLPSNLRPRFFEEGSELEGLDKRVERPSFRKELGGSPRRYRNW